MKHEKVLFKSEEVKTISEVSAFLRQLADKIESGSVTLSQPENSLQLDIPKQVVFEVKVEEETKRNRIKKSLELELEWNIGGDGKLGHGGVSLA